MKLNDDLILEFELADGFLDQSGPSPSIKMHMSVANDLLREEMSKWALLSDYKNPLTHCRCSPSIPIKKDTAEDLLRDIVKGRYHLPLNSDLFDRARKVLEQK